MINTEFQAILKLLKDNDKFVSESAYKKLLSEYKNIKNLILEAKNKSDDEYIISVLSDIISEKNIEYCAEEILNWKKSEKKDIIKIFYILTKVFDDTVEYSVLFNFFENLKRNISVDFLNLTPLEQIRYVNFYLFNTIGFRVGLNDTNIDNNNIYKSITSLNASPLIITFIYYIFIKKLDLPVFFVRNNKLILLAYYLFDDKNIQNQSKIEFNFFINCASKGMVLTKENLRNSFSDLINTKQNFLIQTPTDIFYLFINQLFNISVMQKNKILEQKFKHLMNIFDEQKE
jgi:hypothetical protein